MANARRPRWSPLAGLLVLLLMAGAPRAMQAQVTAVTPRAAGQTPVNPEARKLWEDFNHYVRIARPDMAQAAGAALLGRVSDDDLLDVVEAGDYEDYVVTLTKAARIETLAPISAQLGERIQAARIARARQPDRIMRDIELLAQGSRANYNATQRLRAAGQYAAPALLATLLDDTQKRLHPYVLAAMVSVGRPLVYPLSVALVKLEPVPQGQIAQVLAEIGYPRAMPYLKQVIEDVRTDSYARTIAEAAYRHLADVAGVPGTASAAELFLTLGQNHYHALTRGTELPGLDPGDEVGLVWNYVTGTGLFAVQVPRVIFQDVLAMRAAQTALQLDPNRDAALSLYLMANLRRENLLGDGHDPSYPPHMLEAMFYLKAAGPLRQHDVLDQALVDFDPWLALDAIEALRSTAGTDAMINREGAVQPLLRALSYPDRRVRFAAAFAMTNARPDAPFEGSYSVVPVLGEALRQTEARYAVVIGTDEDATNRMMAMAQELGYEPIGGQTMLQIVDAIRGKPGVDLILTNHGMDQVAHLVRDRVTDYKLSAVPLIILSSPGELSLLHHAYENQRGVYVVGQTNASSELRPVIEQAAAAYAGAPIDAAEATDYANEALDLLWQITLSSGEVFNVRDALPSLMQALGDQRPQIVVKAAHVLALIDAPDGQQAIADAALDETRAVDLRVALLGALAESATHTGNRLNEPQLDKVLDLVQASSGDMALAAARAHGALTLPTSNVVQMLLTQP